jgi:hypothetical protein
MRATITACFGEVSLLHGPFPIVLATSAALTLVASVVRTR